MAASLPSELELQLNYDHIPLSKRLQMVGTTTMTKNSLQTEVNWGPELNFIDAETGFTPLMAAAIGGSASSVSTLIERGADINYQEPKRGRTALLLACKNGRAEVVEVLLHRGAAVSLGDVNGATALMWASKNGHLACVVSLLSRGAGINTFDNYDWTAVHYAAKHGHREVVEVLADAGAVLQVREKLEEGKTPLMLAAQYGRRDTVHALADKGSDVNARTTKDDLTALMLAAKEGHKGTVKALLERGADANIADGFGWTALHFAASWGRKETAVILVVEGGADVNAMPKKRQSQGAGKGGTTPLIIAVKGQQIDVLSALLDHGADPSVNDEATGRNPLAYAAAEGLSAVVHCLIQHRVHLDVRDAKGMTPLMLAVLGAHAESIRLLLAACCDINIMDADNKTALDHATEAGRRDVYLMAILHSSAACKAHLNAWLERDTPKMIRGSPSGGPNVFLNYVLYGPDGLYAGLLSRGPEQDAHLLHNLVMLCAACQRSGRAHPADRPDLANKLDELDEMILTALDSRAFCIDHNLALGLLLRAVPEAVLPDGGFDARFFAAAFVSGPLALYIDCGLTRMLRSTQAGRVIEGVFGCSLLGPGEAGPRGYGTRSVLLRLRYCPAFMFFAEGLSKLLLLALLVAVLRAPGSAASSFSTASDQSLQAAEQALMLQLALSLVYEAGAMEEKAWATSPSVSFDPQELARSRYWGARLHLASNAWQLLDSASLLLLLLWAVLKFEAVGSLVPEGLGTVALSVTAVPLCLGLLRYPAMASRGFGQLVLAVLATTGDLAGFLVLFAASGAGFGIAFAGLFPDLEAFRSPGNCFRTLFDAASQQFDLGLFDAPAFRGAAWRGQVGLALLVLFVVWAVVVLLNMVVAHLVATFAPKQEEAQRQWLLLKATLIRQYLLVQEKSPLCMLPPPLNALPSALYPVHVLYTWRARLFSSKRTCVSFAGSASDLLLKVLVVVPAAAVEFWLACSAEPVAAKRRQMLLTAPAGLASCLASLLVKAFWRDSLAVRLLVKSRLSDGRLRIAYGDSRDETETIGVAEPLAPAALPKPKRGPRAADRTGAKVASTTAATGGGSGPEQQYQPPQQQQPARGEVEGHQGHLWAAAVEGALSKHVGDEEHKAGEDPSVLDLGGLSRQGSVASLLSDISSGELLQRYPPAPEGFGSFGAGLHAPAFAGLFLDHERADIFRNVLPELLGKEAAEHDAARGPAQAVAEMLDALRASVFAALEGHADRQDRQMQAVLDLLQHQQQQQQHRHQQQQQQQVVMRGPGSPYSTFRP